jgi:hypothetical protein
MAKKKMGRPSSYTQEKGTKIAALIAMGWSAKKICAEDDMPSLQTFFNWLRIEPDFLDLYTRAKEEQADALIEEMLDIADDANGDSKVKSQRDRLRIETRKWLASKLKPKRYGDRMIHAGDESAPIATKMDDRDRNVLAHFYNNYAERINQTENEGT